MHLPSLPPIFSGRLSRLIFYLHAPLILISLITLIIMYFKAREKDPVLANLLCPLHLEYILASLCIMLGSMLLGELHERDLERRS